MLLSFLRIHGHSMEPAIKDGQKVLATSVPYFFSNPKPEDIVAFILNNKIFVKRIKTVKDDKYFLEGDNKLDSLDSRKFGSIERRNILAKFTSC